MARRSGPATAPRSKAKSRFRSDPTTRARFFSSISRPERELHLPKRDERVDGVVGERGGHGEVRAAGVVGGGVALAELRADLDREVVRRAALGLQVHVDA